MFTLNKNYLYLAAFIFFTAGTGFYLTDSSSPGGSSSEVSKETVNAGDQINNANTEEEKNKAQNRKDKDRGTTRILFDGSQYLVMKDNYGNKTELRYFKPTTSVKYISLKTLTDGTTTVLLGTWDGSLKRLKPSVITNPWGSTAKEIAVLTGVSTVYKPQPEENSPPPVIKPSPTVLPIPPANQNVNANAQPSVKPSETPSVAPTVENTNQRTVTEN